jgi:HK97 family phage prohead protease
VTTSALARETKTLQFKIKATGIQTTDDGQEFGQIEAYGASFNNVDEGNDRILPGAFTRTIQNSKARAKARDKKYVLKMLWQHDANEVIGGWYDLKEDGAGLLAKGDIALATQRGREFYELAKAEMIDEFSIIYDIPSGGAKYDKSGVRDLSELRLFSIDPVTFPMSDDPHTVTVKSMEGKMDTPKERKTLMEHYNDEMCQDLLEDWQDVYLCSLTKAIFDAFTIGDTPATDVSDALDDFKSLVLGKFVSQASEVNLSQYISDNSMSYSPASNTMQNGASSYGYGWMSRRTDMQQKAGRAISAASQTAIDDHVANMKSIAKAHAKAVSNAADDFAATIQGAEPAYGTDPGDPGPGQQEGKALADALHELQLLRK